MSFEGISPATFLIGAVVVLLAFALLKGRGKEVKQFASPQIMFTMREFNRLNAESVMGAMITDRHGGQREDARAVVIYRTGRLWAKPANGRDPGSMRKREAIYVTRHGDPAPLLLTGLFEKGASIYGAVLKEDWRPIKNLAVKSYMATAKQEGTTHDVIVRRLTALAIITGVIGGLGWLAIPLLIALKG